MTSIAADLYIYLGLEPASAISEFSTLADSWKYTDRYIDLSNFRYTYRAQDSIDKARRCCATGWFVLTHISLRLGVNCERGTWREDEESIEASAVDGNELANVLRQRTLLQPDAFSTGLPHRVVGVIQTQPDVQKGHNAAITHRQTTLSMAIHRGLGRHRYRPRPRHRRRRRHWGQRMAGGGTQ